MLRALSRLATGRRSKWVVIAAWIALAAALAQFQPRVAERAADESRTFLVRGSDSAEVERLLDERFTVGTEVVTTVAYGLPERDDPFLAGAEERIIADASAICASDEIGDLRAVFTPVGPACDLRDSELDIGPQLPPPPVSEDGRVALTTVLTGDEDTESVVRDVEAVRAIVGADRAGEGSGAPGTAVHVTGPGGVDADRAQAVEGIDETLLAITAALILAILLAVYRSPLLALVPLGVVGCAYLIATGAIWGLVAAGATEISGQTTAILIVLMFGAGTDYCLLILARYREEVRAGVEPAAAMAAAAERAGPTIVSAGGIVIGAMALLGLADFNATREMGPILALGMAVMVLAGLTLLPAALAALGRAAFWPSGRRHETPPAEGERDRARPAHAAPVEAPAGSGPWPRAARLVSGRPVAVAVAVTTLLVAGALGNLGGREGLDFTEAFRDDPDSVVGAELIRDHFPPGRTAPLDLVATDYISGEILAPLSELDEIDSANWAAAEPDPAAADAPEDGEAEEPAAGGSLVTGELILAFDPFSERARDFVPELRERIDGLLAEALERREGGEGDEIALLGGFVAEAHDTERAVARDTRLIVPLALLLIFAVLALLLRAIVAPIYLIGTVVLSFAFALGVGSLVFTHLMGQPGSDPSLPIFAFIFLVGLGVDYNVFLVGRIREERLRGVPTRPAVLAALVRTGGVITSAGLILAGTFAALMALTFEALFQFGFVIALGLLVDTFLVRVFLVPAIAYRLDRVNWWPSGRV